MKTKEKQDVKSSDLILSIGLWSFLLVIIVAIIFSFIKNNDVKIAKDTSEILAIQLIDQAYRYNNTLQINGRAPASQPPAMGLRGLLGTDPWGEPFHYAMIVNSQGKVICTLVWSAGKNKVEESINKIESRVAQVSDSIFLGDDIGYKVDVKDQKTSPNNTNTSN